jgi:endonuclease/exonuclease/phosphatase (EEP) superfamily protein YafD
MDYIFARGLKPVETGVVFSDASDHLPLWVKTTPERN